MKVYFGQFYIEPGVDFPFSHLFNRLMSREVSARVMPSPRYVERFGRSFELMFRISAKKRLKHTQIKGPTVFKKAKDVEYTIFLPFKTINQSPNVIESAIEHLFKGVYEVFESLEIDTSAIQQDEGSLIKRICMDPTMFQDRNWDKPSTAVSAGTPL